MMLLLSNYRYSHHLTPDRASSSSADFTVRQTVGGDHGSP